MSHAQLKNVRLAVRAVIFATAVFSAGHANARMQMDALRSGYSLPPMVLRHPTIDPWLSKDEPETDDSGGSCSPSGCIVWADPFPLGVGTGGTGGGGFGGGDGTTGTHDDGSAGPPPPAIPVLLLPDMDVVECAVGAYGESGATSIKFPIAVNNVYAFVNSANNYGYSSYVSTPPVGYFPVGGDTEYNNPAAGVYYPGGGWTEIYASGLEAYDGEINYTDLRTGKNEKIEGPFNPVEMAIFVTAHEVAHQNGLCTTSFVFKTGSAGEALANAYGVSAVRSYRADHGAKCK